MTRPLSDLLRDVTTALACYASTRHAQAHVQKNPAIKAEMLLEVDRIEALEREVRAAAQAEAGVDKDSLTTETPLSGGMTMKHEFPIGTRITLVLTACPVDDTTDGDDEHYFRDEPAVVVEHLHGDPAADYLVYVPRTRRVYPCVPADMAR